MDQFVQYLALTDPAALLPEDPRRLAKEYKLRDGEVCERAAAEKIRNLKDLAKYMFAAHILRKYGTQKHGKLAERIERLCRLHPDFGQEVKVVQVHLALELGEL